MLFRSSFRFSSFISTSKYIFISSSPSYSFCTINESINNTQSDNEDINNNEDESEQENLNFSISPELALPQFKHGFWRKPKLSGRKLSLLKKEYRDKGEEWIDPRPWKRKQQSRRPYRDIETHKGHKWERNREDREKKIQENLKKMPELIKKYHRDERARKVKTYDEEHWFFSKEIKRRQKKRMKKKKKLAADEEEYDIRDDRVAHEADDRHRV